MLECWNAGINKRLCWNAGMLECWNAGIITNSGILGLVPWWEWMIAWVDGTKMISFSEMLFDLFVGYDRVIL